MTWVKVCGLSRRSEARAAADAGADAIGLVLVPGSPRAIRPDAAAAIASSTDVASYLLTMDATPAEVLDLADFTGVTGVQLYGRHVAAATESALRAGFEVLLPVHVSDAPTSLLDVDPAVIPLVDTASDGMPGGTGLRFDTSLLDPAGRDWILAGGLDPDNVAQAIKVAKPWGVDASSGLEIERGRKDLELITRFVEEAKSA